MSHINITLAEINDSGVKTGRKQKEFTEYIQYTFPSDQKGTKVADNIDISHRIYGVYFNLMQFRTPEMYYNASSKLISPRDEAKTPPTPPLKRDELMVEGLPFLSARLMVPSLVM
jgi:hypothetical protein